MNTALVLFNGVWIIIEILSSVSPTLALALESSWYHFCNEKSQTWFHNPWISLCILLILFLLETLSLQLSKDDNFVRVMTVFRDSVGCFGTIYTLFWLGKCIKPISNFSLFHKSWVDHWDSALFGSQLAKDDNVVWIWTVVPHLVWMCSGPWISLQLTYIEAEIFISFSIATVDRR